MTMLAATAEAHLPRVIFAESVRGIVSDRGGDLYDELTAVLCTRGYKVAWRVVDLSSFVAQHRERLLLVAVLGGADPAAALFSGSFSAPPAEGSEAPHVFSTSCVFGMSRGHAPTVMASYRPVFVFWPAQNRIQRITAAGAAALQGIAAPLAGELVALGQTAALHGIGNATSPPFAVWFFSTFRQHLAGPFAAPPQLPPVERLTAAQRTRLDASLRAAQSASEDEEEEEEQGRRPAKPLFVLFGRAGTRRLEPGGPAAGVARTLPPGTLLRGLPDITMYPVDPTRRPSFEELMAATPGSLEEVHWSAGSTFRGWLLRLCVFGRRESRPEQLAAIALAAAGTGRPARAGDEFVTLPSAHAPSRRLRVVRVLGDGAPYPHLVHGLSRGGEACRCLLLAPLAPSEENRHDPATLCWSLVLPRTPGVLCAARAGEAHVVADAAATTAVVDSRDARARSRAALSRRGGSRVTRSLGAARAPRGAPAPPPGGRRRAL